jgi:hypothetical protein
MAELLPKSNADIVALNLVDHAIVDEINTPGESLAKLFDRMAAICRDIGGEYRVANADWNDLVKSLDQSAIEPVVNRQAQTFGDTWASTAQHLLVQSGVSAVLACYPASGSSELRPRRSRSHSGKVNGNAIATVPSSRPGRCLRWGPVPCSSVAYGGDRGSRW